MSYSEPTGPELIVQHTGQVFALTEDAIRIGRGENNSVVLSDPEVSAQHAAITKQEGSYYIEDLGSTNGTYVNEQLVTEPQLLRHGDVIRVGNTVFDIRFGDSPPPPPLPPDEQEAGGIARNPVLIGIAIVLLAGITIICCAIAAGLLFGGRAGRPDVVIQSPADGAQIAAYTEVILQATASGAKDITSLEMSIDGVLVATNSSPDADGASSLTVSTPHVFIIPGEYVISAMARTASGKISATESVKVTVVSAAGGMPSATPTSAPGVGTNTPTPVSGEVTSTPTSVPGEVTSTPSPGTPTPTPTPTPQPDAPRIEYFRANPTTINAGGCTTLEWGQVSGATEAWIEPDIGGVATPGSTTVCPIETTTYILSARGPGGTTTASTAVTVIAALADLTIESVSFNPNPPIQDQETIVTISIRNVGAGAAGAFDWDWKAGSEASFEGRIPGLNAGEATSVEVRWTPADANDRLSTEARVDVNNEVPETDERNNQLIVIVQVLEGSTGGLVTLTSEAPLDGYVATSGLAVNTQEILVGNGNILGSGADEAWRGFLSFDLSAIPSTAQIESIELRFFQVQVQGDPYGKLGSLILDHVDYGSRLSYPAFDVPAMNIATLPQQTAPNVWYITTSGVVGDWLQEDLQLGRDRFQLRLRFSTESDGDGLEDYAAIESGDNFLGTGNLPLLVVTYGP
jgi:hypothetical protein